MKMSQIALPLVMTCALAVSAGGVYAAGQNGGMPQQYMPANGMPGGHGPMMGQPGMPMNGPMGPGMQPGMPMGKMGSVMMNGMGGMCGMGQSPRGMLSPDGQARGETIMGDYRPRMDKLRSQLFVKNMELRALCQAASPDVKAVSAAASEVANADIQFRNLNDELQKILEKDVYAPERKAWEEQMKALPKPQAAGK